MENMTENCSHLIFDLIGHNDLQGLQMVLNEHPDAIETMDRYLNTPLLYACHLGRNRIVGYLLRIGANFGQLNIFGQNALTLATYSGNLDTCQTILDSIDFNAFNTTGLLTPLCVATLQGNIEIAKLYLQLESSNRNAVNNCPSETVHGVCPLQLAEIKSDTKMMELLWPKHQLHLSRPAKH